MSAVGFKPKDNRNSIKVVNEIPAGDKDGVNLTYTTAQPFIAGTLEVYLSGLKLIGDQSDPMRDYDEAGDLKGFTLLLEPNDRNRLNTPPCQDESLTVNYLVEPTCRPHE